MKKHNTDLTICMVLILCIMVGIYLYGAGRVCSFSIFPDEFGYWATAAKLCGYDWSAQVSHGYYYSYGYGLLLYPILKFAPDGIAAYRVALLLNLILQMGAFGLLYRLAHYLFPETSEKVMVTACAAGVFYPGWIMYMQTTLTDSLLMFLFILIIFLLCRYLVNGRRSDLVLMTVVLAYAYTVHMRTIALWIAALITMGCICMGGRIMGTSGAAKLLPRNITSTKIKKDFLMMACISALLFDAACFGKHLAQKYVFNGLAENSAVKNTYAGQLDNIRNVFSLSGIGKFLTGYMGEIFYLAAACGGLVAMLIYGLAHTRNLWNKTGNGKTSVADGVMADVEKNTEPLMPVLVYVLRSITLLIGVSTVFLMKMTKVDNYVYGRYIDPVVPVVIFLGIMIFYCTCGQKENGQKEYVYRPRSEREKAAGRDERTACRDKKTACRDERTARRDKKTAGRDGTTAYVGGMMVYVLVTALLLFLFIKKSGTTGMRGYMACSLAYFIPAEFELGIFLLRSALGILALTACTYFLIWATARKNTYFLWILIAVELAGGMWLNNKYTYTFNEPHFSNRQIIDFLEQHASQNSGSSLTPDDLYFLREDARTYVDVLQMQMKDVTLREETAEQILEERPQAVLTYRWTEYSDILMEIYPECMETDTYLLFYVEEQ